MPSSSGLLKASDSQLLLIDVQEKLLPAMHEPAGILDNCRRLAIAADRLSVPLTITEQYPEGLGGTVGDVKDAIPDFHPVAKTSFSGARQEGVKASLGRDASRKSIVLAGIETHICALQTALELKSEGWDVAVVEDACGSRRPASHASAIRRLNEHDIPLVTTEMVIFEWLEGSSHPAFRELSRLIR